MTSSTAQESDLLISSGYRQVLGELFHRLSQPLTGLRCSLALSRKASQSHRLHGSDARIALQQVEDITWLTACIREMIEVGDPAQGTPALLDDCLTEVVEEFLPVADSNDMKLRLVPGSRSPVNLDERRVKQAVFHLLDFALTASSKGTQITLKLEEKTGNSVLTMRIAPARGVWLAANPSRKDNALQCRVRLAIARRILESAGGAFHAHTDQSCLVISFRIPFASEEPALPLSRPLRRPA